MRASSVRRWGRMIAGRAAWLLIAACLNASAGAAVGASDMPWSYLRLQASRLGGVATVEVEIETLPAAEEARKFIDPARGRPFAVSGTTVLRLSVVTTLDILGSKRVVLENRLWFDPLTRTPLYLIRTRFGLKDYYQRFRFTADGVFRQQREPAASPETGNPPETWSRLGQHFYPYPADRTGCPSIHETSMLIPLVGVLALDSNDATASLCVFHQRQVHRVSVNRTPAQPVDYDYLEQRGSEEVRRMGIAAARAVRMVSHPIGSYRGDVENFFGDGSRLYFSPDTELPLVVSGELPLIGRVEMQLKEVRLK